MPIIKLMLVSIDPLLTNFKSVVRSNVYYRTCCMLGFNREVRLKDVDTQRLSKQAVVQQSQRRSLHNTL